MTRGPSLIVLAGFLALVVTGCERPNLESTGGGYSPDTTTAMPRTDESFSQASPGGETGPPDPDTVRVGR